MCTGRVQRLIPQILQGDDKGEVGCLSNVEFFCEDKEGSIWVACLETRLVGVKMIVLVKICTKSSEENTFLCSNSIWNHLTPSWRMNWQFCQFCNLPKQIYTQTLSSDQEGVWMHKRGVFPFFHFTPEDHNCLWAGTVLKCALLHPF